MVKVSDQKGGSCAGINKKRITDLARKSKPVSESRLEEIIEKHFNFLSNGGAGGKWQTLLVKGMVVGIYDLPVTIKNGEQATFERANLSKVQLANKVIPFANFC